MIDSYIAVDVETTGLEVRQEKITELALVRVEGDTVTDCFSTLVNPGRPISEMVSSLTGITDAMVKDAPAVEEVIGDALDFAGDLPLLWHNLLFDYRFIKKAAVNSGLAFERQGIDTLHLCRLFMGTEQKKNLTDACAFYQIPQPQAHRALADAQSAHLLFQRLKGLYGGERPQAFVPASLFYQPKREQPATKRQKEYLQDLIKCHRINITVQLDALSRSEASRMIDRIILQHGRPFPKGKHF